LGNNKNLFVTGLKKASKTCFPSIKRPTLKKAESCMVLKETFSPSIETKKTNWQGHVSGFKSKCPSR